jgi:hypothetical protein
MDGLSETLLIRLFNMNIQGSLTKHGENEEVDNPETPSQVFFLNSSKCKQVLCYSSAET